MPPQMARRCAGPAPSPPLVDPNAFRDNSTPNDHDIPPHLARLESKDLGLEATLVVHIRRPMEVVWAAMIEPQTLGQWMSAAACGAGEAGVQLFGDARGGASQGPSRSERRLGLRDATAGAGAPPVWVHLFGPIGGTAVLVTIALSEGRDRVATLVAWETRLASLAALVDPGASPLNDAARLKLRSQYELLIQRRQDGRHQG